MLKMLLLIVNAKIIKIVKIKNLIKFFNGKMIKEDWEGYRQYAIELVQHATGDSIKIKLSQISSTFKFILKSNNQDNKIKR